MSLNTTRFFLCKKIQHINKEQYKIYVIGNKEVDILQKQK